MHVSSLMRCYVREVFVCRPMWLPDDYSTTYAGGDDNFRNRLWLLCIRNVHNVSSWRRETTLRRVGQ